MKQEVNLIRARLKTPRAAAVAGVLFSVLLITGLLLLRLSVPADPLEAGAWLKINANTVALALNLVPFAGIAFYGSSACCVTGSESLKTASLPPSFWVAGFCSSRCCSPRPRWRAASS